MKPLYYTLHAIIAIIFAFLYDSIKSKLGISFEAIMVGLVVIIMFLLNDIQVQMDRKE